MGNDSRVRFVNKWIKDLLPRADSTELPTSLPAATRTTQHDISHLDGNREERKASSDPGQEEVPESVEAFLSAIHASQTVSLDSLIRDTASPESTALLESTKFTYQSPAKEYHFTLKKCDVLYMKDKCKAILVNDHTAIHELEVVEEKYRKILLASVAHDIRNPIQGIAGILDVLDTPERTEEEKQYLRVGRSTCKQLTFLTYDITDMGQLEAGKLKVSASKFSPLEAVNDCVSIFNFSYQAHGIHLVVIPGQFARKRIFSDQNRYMQIVINLLGNAMKFTLSGGLVSVTLSEDIANGTLRTEVKDTGTGIKEEEVPHLFRLFGKLESSSSLNPRGVGLGLTICKRLSKALGGDMTVSSVFGRGSTFSFSIKMGNEEDKGDKGVEDSRTSMDPLEGTDESKANDNANSQPRSLQVHRNKFIDAPPGVGNVFFLLIAW